MKSLAFQFDQTVPAKLLAGNRQKLAGNRSLRGSDSSGSKLSWSLRSGNSNRSNLGRSSGVGLRSGNSNRSNLGRSSGVSLRSGNSNWGALTSSNQTTLRSSNGYRSSLARSLRSSGNPVGASSNSHWSNFARSLQGLSTSRSGQEASSNQAQQVGRANDHRWNSPKLRRGMTRCPRPDSRIVSASRSPCVRSVHVDYISPFCGI